MIKKEKGVTGRALVIGILLLLINCWWVIQKQNWYALGPPDTLSLFYNSVLSVLVLILINSFLKKFLPKSALSQGELLVIYVMISIATALGGIDLLQILAPVIGAVFYFATPENEWKELLFRYIPRWLTVDNESVLKGYYEGSSTFYTSENLKAWGPPLLWWTVFLLLLFFVMTCITVIIRKQWIENEKLTYPIIQLPFEMTKGGGSRAFFSSRMFWLGFALAGGVDLINGLHVLYPTVPLIPLSRMGIKWSDSFEIGHYFTEKPWRAIGWTPLCVYPFAVGLAFLMPLDLSFSCWFFYFFRKAQLILGDVLGLHNLPGFPYLKPQASGAYLALCVLALWGSRRHLKAVLRKAIGNNLRVEDSDEPMRYRTAVLGIAVGMLLIVLFCDKAGMTVWAIIIFFALYFAIAIAITRMRAELGPPAHELEWGGPIEIMTNLFRTRRLGPGNLTMFSIFLFFNRCYRSHPMPHVLEGFKLAERAKIGAQHKLVYAMLISALISIPALCWTALHIGYKIGGACEVWVGRYTYERLAWWLTYPGAGDYPAAAFTGVGFILTLLLMVMRVRFFWWQVHPVAYPLSSSWTMNMLWFSILVSWAIKRMILKYGGLGSQRYLSVHQ